MQACASPAGAYMTQPTVSVPVLEKRVWVEIIVVDDKPPTHSWSSVSVW